MFLWIPLTHVITADGWDDWGDENDGVLGRPRAITLPRTRGEGGDKNDGAERL